MPDIKPSLPFYSQSPIVDEILKELKRIKKEYPYPDHAMSRAGLVGCSAGDLLEASKFFKYSNGDREAMKKAAIQTAAQCIRLLENL